MKRTSILMLAAIAVCAIALISFAAGRTDDEAAPIFGIKVPSGYRDWKLISVAHEAGNLNDFRAVLGNDIAINAYREGKLPLPDGAIMPGWPGVTFRRRKTTKSLAVSNPSLPGLPQTSSSWSKIQRNMPRQAAGGSLNSKTAKLTTRQTSKLASLATSPSKIVILSLHSTRPHPS